MDLRDLFVVAVVITAVVGRDVSSLDGGLLAETAEVQQLSTCTSKCFAACPAGMSCGACSDGHESQERQCATCEPGTYSPVGSTQCSTCNPGTASARGSGICSQCPVGKTSGAGAQECYKPPPYSQGSLCADNLFEARAQLADYQAMWGQQSTSPATAPDAADDADLASSAFQYWQDAAFARTSGCAQTNIGGTLDMKHKYAVDARISWGQVSTGLCFEEQEKNLEDRGLDAAFFMAAPNDPTSFTLEGQFKSNFETNPTHYGWTAGDPMPTMPYGKCEMTLCFPLLSDVDNPVDPLATMTVSGGGWWLYGEQEAEKNAVCGNAAAEGFDSWDAVTGAEVAIKVLKLTRCQEKQVVGEPDQEECKVIKECNFDNTQDVKVQCRGKPWSDNVVEKSIAFANVNSTQHLEKRGLMEGLSNLLRLKCMGI